jgi:hypothetical protein
MDPLKMVDRFRPGSAVSLKLKVPAPVGSRHAMTMTTWFSIFHQSVGCTDEGEETLVPKDYDVLLQLLQWTGGTTTPLPCVS